MDDSRIGGLPDELSVDETTPDTRAAAPIAGATPDTAPSATPPHIAASRKVLHSSSDRRDAMMTLGAAALALVGGQALGSDDAEAAQKKDGNNNKNKGGNNKNKNRNSNAKQNRNRPANSGGQPAGPDGDDDDEIEDPGDGTPEASQGVSDEKKKKNKN
jgi:hypothetical protein